MAAKQAAADSENMVVKALRLQDSPPVYVTVIPGRWLLEHTTPSWRMKEPIKGFQRIVNQQRAKCQRKVETSGFLQNRNFRFQPGSWAAHANLIRSAAGSRPRRRCKAEATESAPKQSAQALLNRLKPCGGLSCTGCLSPTRRPPVQSRGFAIEG